MTKQPSRVTRSSVATGHETRIRRVETPRDPPWLYFTPVAPAAIPDDYITGYAAYVPFEPTWQNIGVDFNGRAVPATSFRIFEGKLQVRFFCTGDEANAPSLIGTLPTGFRPNELHPIDVVMGDDKLSRGTIEVRADGEVWFMGTALDFVVPGTDIDCCGIQCETVNVCDWFFLEVDDSTGSPNGWGYEIQDPNGMGMTMDTNGGGLDLRDSGGNFANLTADANGTAAISSTGNSYVRADTTGVTVFLAAGLALTIVDSGNNPIFRVDEDGDIHIGAGKTITADL